MSDAAAAVQARSSSSRSWSPTEDWLAVIIGLLVVALALAGTKGQDLLGWVVTTSVWTDVTVALGPAAKAYGWLGVLVPCLQLISPSSSF